MSKLFQNANISSSYAMLYVDDVKKSKSIMVERCPLCNGTKRSFYCCKCINSGQFFESNKSEKSFCIKQELYNQSKEKFQEKQYQLNKALSYKEFIASKNNEKVLLQFNIKHVKLKIERYKKNIKLRQDYLNEIIAGNKLADRDSNLMKLKLDRIQQHLDGCPKRLDSNILNLRRCKFDLMKCRQDQTRHLVQDIFLIRAIAYKNSQDSGDNSCINLLSDARNTEYVKGEWILSDSVQNGNQIYKIIEAYLPANGQYDKIKIHNEMLRGGDATKSISAALCLLTQIVSIISIILDDYLISNISLKDFILPTTNSKLFSKCVGKLNSNVLQLCELQHINVATLRSTQPIINLLKVLESPRFGSDEPNQPHDGDAQDAAVNESLEMLDDSADSNDDCNDVALDDRDWEYVPVSLPEVEMSTPSTNSTSYFSSTILQNGQTELQSTMTNFATGLVSSASLFWKGWNTKTDK